MMAVSTTHIRRGEVDTPSNTTPRAPVTDYQEQLRQQQQQQQQQYYSTATWAAGRGTTEAGPSASSYHSPHQQGSYNSWEGTVQRIRSPSTRVWFCCTPGCPLPGPYNYDLYENCMLGCGHIRCPQCGSEEVPAPNRDSLRPY